jgi:FkbM family methyltransferase
MKRPALSARRLMAPIARAAARLHRPKIDKYAWLREMGIRTILDVGANTGQFAREIRTSFPDAQLYSFEPLGDCFRALTEAFQRDLRFHAFNIALGAIAGETEIHRSAYSPSSSLRRMGALHKANFPHTAEEFAERVRVARLDDLAPELDLAGPVLAKLDVQGYEDKVIEGGKAVLSLARVLFVELSVEPLYDGQPLFDDIYRTLVGMGFTYRGSINQLLSPLDGRVLQTDGVFVRS